MMMRWEKWGAQALIRSGVLAAFERREAQQQDILRVLAYHRVGDPIGDCVRGDPSLISVTPDGFAEQMAFLATHYHVVSVAELLDAVERSRPLPPRSTMITFDDGYHDFLDYAWPVLSDLRLPAVLFVPSSFLAGGGQIFWWDSLQQAFNQTSCHELRLPALGIWQWHNEAQRDDALQALKRALMAIDHDKAMALVDETVKALGVTVDGRGMMLTWDEVRHMADCGLTVAAHTVTHPILSRISSERARQEIVGSHEAIRRELGRVDPVFCYPVGHLPDLRPELLSVLQKEGFRAAFTMIEGHNLLARSNPLRLKRVGIAPHLTLDEFRLVLTGAYNLYGALVRRGAEWGDERSNGFGRRQHQW